MYQWRLPNGEFTSDPDIYADTWTQLAERVLVFFPGFYLVAFNPDFVFATNTENRYGDKIQVARFTLPLMAAEALLHSPVDGQ